MHAYRGTPGPGRPSRGRGSAAEGFRFASERGPGPWGEHPPDCHNAVERYPERPPGYVGPSGFCHGRLHPWLFCLRKKGLSVGPKDLSGGKTNESIKISWIEI